MENYNQKIKDLVKRFNLNYTFNPGGAEFYSRNLEYKQDLGSFHNRCQIMAYNDQEDYEKLEKWLQDYPF